MCQCHLLQSSYLSASWSHFHLSTVFTIKKVSAHGAELGNERKGQLGNEDSRRPMCQRGWCSHLATLRSWLSAHSSLKAPLKISTAFGFETLAISTSSHKNASELSEHLVFCSKRFHFHKQILPEGQQVTVHNPSPHLCSRSGMSLFMRAVVTCCSISNTSSHPVRIWVARAKILTFNS